MHIFATKGTLSLQRIRIWTTITSFYVVIKFLRRVPGIVFLQYMIVSLKASLDNTKGS